VSFIIISFIIRRRLIMDGEFGMELRHLRYFVTLAEQLHFARAAEILGIAPPTLTIQIQDIERILDAKLFVRTKRAVALTPAGEVFLIEARAVIEQFSRAESAGRRAGRGEVGRIELGYVGSAVYGGAAQVQISMFRRAWPSVHINAREFPMDNLPDLINGGQVDIGFIRFPVKLPDTLCKHTLFEDIFCVALPADHPQSILTTPLHPKDLATFTFIIPEQPAGTYEVARRGGFVPEIVSAPGSLLAVLAQVSLGLGIAVVPSVLTAAMHIPNVIFRRLGSNPFISEVGAIFRGEEHSPVVKKLIEQITRSHKTSFSAHKL
jgi:DNA-binding transcriptional LysR family regulator